MFRADQFKQKMKTTTFSFYILTAVAAVVGGGLLLASVNREEKEDDDEDDEEDEALVEQSIEVIHQTNRASVSILQRRLRIGYTRAARIMDLLEERGIVGPNKGAEPRDILTDLDQRAQNNEP